MNSCWITARFFVWNISHPGGLLFCPQGARRRCSLLRIPFFLGRRTSLLSGLARCLAIPGGLTLDLAGILRVADSLQRGLPLKHGLLGGSTGTQSIAQLKIILCCKWAQTRQGKTPENQFPFRKIDAGGKLPNAQPTPVCLATSIGDSLVIEDMASSPTAGDRPTFSQRICLRDSARSYRG
jgi:hypothetical protein